MSIEDMLDALEGMCSKLRSAMSSGAQTGDESGSGEGAENAGEAGKDTVEGLEGTAREGKDEGGEGASANGRASAGPAAGKHEGADAALRAFHADLGAKNRLYERLSKVVGVFDGKLDVASATSADLARYGVKRLGLKCADGMEVLAIDTYLTAVEKARNDSQRIVAKQTADAAADQEVPAIDKYFKE